MNHVFIGPDFWGDMSEEQARQWSEVERRIFPCGICSDEEHKAYHNVLGVHNHSKPWITSAAPSATS